MTPPTAGQHSDLTTPRHKRVFWLSVIVGVLLSVIGIRFFLVPESASFTFGAAYPPKGHELHYIVAIRDIWLGVLAMALAWLHEWRALALWFVGAAICCLTDVVIVNQSTANGYAMAYHVAAGVLCLALARGAWMIAPGKD